MSATIERRAFVAAENEILRSYRADFIAAIKANSTVGITRIFKTPETVTVELTEDVAPRRATVEVHWGNLSATFRLVLKSLNSDGDGIYSVEEVHQ
jgi:hypothetical protein